MTAFTRGLHEIGGGLFAWLQPDGGWGWSSAGLIVEGTPGDGAAALVLASEEAVKRLNLKPIARIVSFSDGEQAPEWFTTAPTISVPKAIKLAGLQISDIDYFEINEAFASVVLKYQKDLGIPDEKLNVNGGAIAMGHPLGATGAMILGTVLDELERTNKHRAVITLCIGGGMGVATLIERV